MTVLIAVLALILLGRGRGVGLVSALVPLIWFSATIESRWGEKDIDVRCYRHRCRQRFWHLSPMFSQEALARSPVAIAYRVRYGPGGERP